MKLFLCFAPLLAILPACRPTERVAEWPPPEKAVKIDPLQLRCEVFDLDSAKPSKPIQGLGAVSQLHSFRQNEVACGVAIDRCEGSRPGSYNTRVTFKVQLKTPAMDGSGAAANLEFEVRQLGKDTAELKKEVFISRADRGVHFFLSNDKRQLFVFRWRPLNLNNSSESKERTLRGALLSIGKPLPPARFHYLLSPGGETRVKTCVSWCNLGLALEEGENGGLGLPIETAEAELSAIGRPVPEVLTFFKGVIQSDGFPSKIRVLCETAKAKEPTSAVRIRGTVEFEDTDMMFIIPGEVGENFLVVFLDE